MITKATVETLTAAVHVLMVGNRQVTLSVARQLDEVDPDEMEPMGRVRLGRTKDIGCGFAELIGRHRGSGELVYSIFEQPGREESYRFPEWALEWEAIERLPLIVLAGLR